MSKVYGNTNDVYTQKQKETFESSMTIKESVLGELKSERTY